MATKIIWSFRQIPSLHFLYEEYSLNFVRFYASMFVQLIKFSKAKFKVADSNANRHWNRMDEKEYVDNAWIADHVEAVHGRHTKKVRSFIFSIPPTPDTVLYCIYIPYVLCTVWFITGTLKACDHCYSFVNDTSP